MMKETNFCPVLLLLLLAVTPRNSCANQIASPGGMMNGAHSHFSSPIINGRTGGAPANMSIAEDMKEWAERLTAAMPWLQEYADFDGMMDGSHAHFPGPIVNGTTGEAPANMSIAEGMKEGADIPTAAMTWLQDNGPRSSHFDESILDGTMDGAHTNMSIIEGMKEGADILTAAMTVLQDNVPQSSHFDESIFDLKNQIMTLPSELVEHRIDILEGLFNSQDRFKTLNIVLEVAATNLMRHCNTLLLNFDNNDISENLLNYSAKKFVKFAKLVIDDLETALLKTKEIKALLLDVKAFIIEINAKQDYEKKEIEAKQEAAGDDIQKLKTKLENQKQELEKMLNEDEQYTDKVTILSCIFTLNFDCTITTAITNTNMQAPTYEAVPYRMELERKIMNTNMRVPTYEAVPYRMELDHRITNRYTRLPTYEADADRMEPERRIKNTNMQAATYEAVADRMELERKIDILEKQQILIDIQSELVNKIKSATNSTTTLLSHVEVVKHYLEMEINLITEWQLSLAASISDTEDNKCNIKGIKEKLNVLIKACIDYLFTN